MRIISRFTLIKHFFVNTYITRKVQDNFYYVFFFIWGIYKIQMIQNNFKIKYFLNKIQIITLKTLQITQPTCA